MNYERMSAEIPTLYRLSRESREADLLNGLLGWIRNEAFGKIAEACALWGAIVQANKHLAKVDRTLHARNIEHEHFNLKEVLNSELKQAKEMMDAIPGGRRATTVTTEEDFSLAIKRLKFLREYK
ncbi:hypothetical protein DTO013E5_2219 [Penicillium roqueforti]|uniref:Uncharacterized protein n=1 Tax=Penicillium roqueforti (strain FM164) TaxID=1365484 RepID=W6Q558_PENRF|nr:uncharacterized protein LCP9604111_1232 [Penicillium roqueforti]CDM31485.1 hypothetical protein PROQFM164_S02g001635 [Penicillium roqueforti FM164]KAF9253706.1 hypothetical protein LCP9604111_1232 [Penicillium roqueforti]KAI1829917.1 hypothetical protein CBS147337_9296 [Penicillium roqueforti]KAI2686276.1 hypothetical protein CBS147355_1763 [Penicillium roqueforti]KAI2687418.1 hypothetical protein LCP963914a_4019 [Penicillium roqueforti]